jgi:hypothetical protein
MHENDRVLVSAKCPRCYHLRVVTYTRGGLTHSLGTGAPIECFCIDCGETWAVSTAEREAIARGLEPDVGPPSVLA